MCARRITVVSVTDKVSDVKRLLQTEGLILDEIKVPPRKKSGKAEFPWPGWSPLHVACWRGNSAIIRLLIENGADVNLMNDRQQVAPLPRRPAIADLCNLHRRPCILQHSEGMQMR